MKFVVATENQGKLLEFQRILEPFGIEVTSLKELGITPRQKETGATFAENAKIKALDIFTQAGLPTIADDSGLCIDALEGMPGVYSSRYGGEDWTQEQQTNLLLSELQDTPEEERTAHFVCHICCVLDADNIFHVEEIGRGSIGYEPQGAGGFGYDPIFMVGDESYAEISLKKKNEISHRGKALREFARRLEEKLK